MPATVPLPHPPHKNILQSTHPPPLTGALPPTVGTGILNCIPSSITRRRPCMRYHWLLPLCLTFSTSRAAADELTFEGRPLTAWVERLRSQDQAGRTDALRAFYQLGEDAAEAVPGLVRL